MPAKIVQSASVAKQFISEVHDSIQSKQMKPKMVGFLSNSDPSARLYAEWTAKTCSQTGIEFQLIEVPRTQLEEKLSIANEDDSIHGIMIYYPVFGGTQDQYLQNSISVWKDVEGLCHTYRYNMYHNIRELDGGMKCIIPCTPLAIVKILEFIECYDEILPIGNRLQGKTVTIINRSEVVGRPLAALLANDGAKVYSVDEFGVLEFHRGAELERHEVVETSIVLKEALGLSDIVIAGVPSEGYNVNVDVLKEGVVAINFSSFKNFPESIKEKASIYVPSVGKVTVAMLERNLLRLCEYQKIKKGRN